MRADDDVDRAVGKPRLDLLHLGRRHKARGVRDLDRQAPEALLEGAVMLAGEKRRRHDDGDLLAGDRRREGRPQRDLGLAEADVAAHEPVHRPPDAKVLHDGVDRALLVLGLLIGEAGRELVVEPFRGAEAGGLAQDAGGGDLHQRARHLADALFHPRLAGLPGAAAEPVELDLGLLRPVAGQELDVLDRQEQPVAAVVVDLEAVMRRARGLDRLQPLEAADAVVDVDDEVAGRQRRRLGDEVLRPARAPLRAHQPVAEDVLLGEDGEVAGLEARFEAPDGDRDRVLRSRERVGEAPDRLRLRQAVVVEHVAEPLARAFRPRGEHHPPPLPLQGADVGHGGIEDVRALLGPLGDEVAPAPRRAIDDDAAFALRQSERGQARNREILRSAPPIPRA